MNANTPKTLWFKSSYSSSDRDCVEVAFLEQGAVGVRDSKNPTGPALVFDSRGWDTFTTNVVRGRFCE
ncbi:DUF397 domain-containing protein [Nocardia callitridis]|uniref:DUF397 domain-containing protein n=1 Tax=Nocardia callitridis TaxID=648753 RepID=A0ABP9L1U6_9NOCA